MYNYQRALLEYGMVIINFLDAISEGDGARLLRNWKFLLLYFQHDTGSQKYSLEALYLMFQVYALLSPKQLIILYGIDSPSGSTLVVEIFLWIWLWNSLTELYF